jgi:hypothetical protein
MGKSGNAGTEGLGARDIGPVDSGTGSPAEGCGVDRRDSATTTGKTFSTTSG